MFFKKKVAQSAQPIQQTNTPPQSEPVKTFSRRTNRKLLSFLQDRLPSLWCWVDYVENPKTQYSKEHLVDTLVDFLDIIMEPPFFNDKEMAHFRQIYAYPSLTQRQFCCASLVSKHCCKDTPRIDLALHELMDCIDNNGETYRVEREISPEEHLLYWTLAQMIFATIKHTIV